MGSSQENRATVGLRIIDAIRNADALGGGTEVVIVDVGGGWLPLNTGVLKVPNQLPFFGIHAQNRIATLLELIPLPAEIAELAVAVRSGAGGNSLAVGTQGKLHLPQQPTYGIAADRDSQPLELAGDLVRGLPGPLQPADRVAGGFSFHQLVDRIDHRWRFFPPACGRHPGPAPGPRPHPGPTVAVAPWLPCVGPDQEVRRSGAHCLTGAIPDRRTDGA